MAWLLLLLTISGFEAQIYARDIAYTCPAGWWQRGAKCFRQPSISSYNDAVDACSGSAKGHLFVPSSQDEYDHVIKHFNGSIYDNIRLVWLGCKKAPSESIFQCFDGTQLNDSSAWWEELEPDGVGVDPINGTGLCVAYERFTKKIEDTSCYAYPLGAQLCQTPAKVKMRSDKFSMTRDVDGTLIKNHCLMGHGRNTIPTSTRTRCAVHCLNDDLCMSFNIKYGECVLNNSTRHDVDHDFFQAQQGCTYFDPIMIADTEQ